MPIKYGKGYATIPRYAAKKTERRIKIPQPTYRPVRFAAASLLRKELITEPSPWWFTLHRRGPRQKVEGEDQLEARAVSKDLVRGTLPERIVYKALVEDMHFSPDEIGMQTSLQGGRIDTGGIVADFLFPYLMIVIQVQGPTHYEYLRGAKDDEQRMALEEMGYRVYEIFEEDIYDEYRLMNWLRKTFGWTHSGATGETGDFDGDVVNSHFYSNTIMSELDKIQEILNGIT